MIATLGEVLGRENPRLAARVGMSRPPEGGAPEPGLRSTGMAAEANLRDIP
jgi:hypothetical protein